MSLIKVGIIGALPHSMNMLQRKISGIVSGIATVESYHIDELGKCDAQVLVAYAHGHRLQKVFNNKWKEDVRTIGVELTLLPAAVRTLRILDSRLRLAIVAEHQSCSNEFFSEIVKAGVRDHKCITGTFEDITVMNADRYIIPEELTDLINKYCERIDKKKTILVPRTITPKSAADIINAVLEYSKYY